MVNGALSDGPSRSRLNSHFDHQARYFLLMRTSVVVEWKRLSEDAMQGVRLALLLKQQSARYSRKR